MKHAAPLLLLISIFDVHSSLAQVPEPAGSGMVALMPLKRGARDSVASHAVEAALQLQITQFGELVGPDKARDVLRRWRLRDIDAATSDTLRQVATEIGVDWLVTSTLHDVTSHRVPDMTVSIRFYDGRTGRLAWAGFMGRSGLDSRKLLGLGEISSKELLAPELVRRLLDGVPLADVEQSEKTSRDRSSSELSTRGIFAVVPFTSYVDQDAQSVADAATEAATAVLLRIGTHLASPGCVRESLRHQHAQAWGELAAETRDYLHTTCEADWLLTGAVEQWDLGGSGLEPEPLVAVSVRLLDAASGRILWLGAKEAGGWDRESLFGAGRVHSRGVLLDRILSRLSEDLSRETPFSTGQEPTG